MKARRTSTFVLTLVVAVSSIAMCASSAFATSTLLPLKVSVNGKVVGQVPTSIVTTFTSTGSKVDTDALKTWVAQKIAKGVDHKVVNWSSKVDAKHKKIVFSHSDGFQLDQPGSVTLITNKISTVTTDTFAPVTLALPHKTLAKPKKLGKQILVVQSRTKIYLYDNDKVVKTYRCAVGQRAWPTPNGTFHIGKKVKNPTWTNGGASWSKGMPSYIGPGPNNPLGLFAMYVYYGTSGGSDTGVRFHGVPSSELSSIGHAASHGCCRMRPKDIKDFFKRVTVGTLVNIIK